MSSLRNAVKRKTHKERSQPAARKHLGLLEKHSDYKLRADNYHKKQERIKTLSRKASERNEDEFYRDDEDGRGRGRGRGLERDARGDLGAQGAGPPKQRVSTALQRLEAEKHVLNAKGRKRKVAAGDRAGRGLQVEEAAPKRTAAQSSRDRFFFFLALSPLGLLLRASSPLRPSSLPPLPLVVRAGARFAAASSSSELSSELDDDSSATIS
ncbi:hypothetical protein JL722_11933 [Aureococcus anophagefferens]|nr:hypothetical protein JL722_11933 [Aureococcus anophagefferens]